MDQENAMRQVAVVDIGSNSTRLLVAGVQGGRVRPLKTDLLITRLGEGMGSSRFLLPEAMARTKGAIRQFLHQLGPIPVLLVATSAVRDAENQNDFVNMIRNELGLKVKILTGKEEANWTYRGVQAGLNMACAPAAIMDLGGGSTEFIWSAGGKIRGESVDIGAVRASEGRYDAARIIKCMQPVMDKILEIKPAALIGVGGTVTTLSAISLGLKEYQPSRVHGHQLAIDEVERLYQDLSGKTVAERKAIAGLQPGRADIIDTGARIVFLVMNYLKIKLMTVSEADLLYGLALAAAQNVERNDGNGYQN